MRRSFLALAVTASLVTSQPSLLGQFWDLLSAVWSESSADAGCIFDPDGRCIPAARPQSDEGCIFDPNGAPCRPGS